MAFWRKKVWETVSRARGEPTDNPLHGAFIESEILENIRQTEFINWIREGAEPGGEVNEENFPHAWRSGRELARARYADRLKKLEPIPRTDPEIAKAAIVETDALKYALLTFLQFEVNGGRISSNEVSSNAIKACCMSYGKALLKLFGDHWNS